MSSIEELKFVKSQYSLNDLEEFRDADGFIDLSKIEIEYTKESREKKGKQERLKNWVDFNGTKVLIRGADLENYSIYAELIVEEIANQLGIESAHYDLVKCKDQEGKDIVGVLSKSMIDFDKEELITLHDLIGDEPEIENECVEYTQNTSLNFTIDKLKKRFEKIGYDQKDIEDIIYEYKKRMIFHLSVVDTDKHSENIAFITDRSGNQKLRLSPNYDSENSLLLDYGFDVIKSIFEGKLDLESEVDIADPKIVYKVEQPESLWRETLKELCEDERVKDYCKDIIKNRVDKDIIKNRVDMDIVLDNVEKKIKAPLPKEVRELAKQVYNIRIEEMEKVYEPKKKLENKIPDGYRLLAQIILQDSEEEIRTGELIQVGKKMEEDMQKRNVDKENNIGEK